MFPGSPTTWLRTDLPAWMLFAVPLAIAVPIIGAILLGGPMLGFPVAAVVATVAATARRFAAPAVIVAAGADAARELDAAPKSRTSGRYALIATLMFAGPRDDEIGHALVRDLDLARSKLDVGRSKTAAGMRTTSLLPVVHDVLAEYKATHPGTLDDLLFATARGHRRDEDNINKRVLKPALVRADELLAERGQRPLPRGVTPHKLRHTFASILIALGRDPRYVMDQLGHTDPKFTLRIYGHVMRIF